MMNKFSGVLLVIFTASLSGLRAQEDPTASAFLKEAMEVLPVQKRYDYHKALAAGPVHEPLREPGAVPADHEMEIDSAGWRILISEKAGDVVTFAAEDFREFLEVSMQVRAEVTPVASLENWADEQKAVLVGTVKDLPGMGSELKSEKDYEIQATPGRIVVCGKDVRGAMFGLFNVESRMGLRGGPFLPKDLATVRHSLYQSRMVISWLGFMQWPDSLLSHVVHDGYDSIFTSVYANPNGVEGPPHYDIIRKQTAGRLNDVIDRAEKKGIKVYTPILYNNMRDEENKEKLREHVRDIVTKFPKIKGYVLLTEGFYFEKFFGAGGHGKQDLKEWAGHWTEAVRIVAEEAHRIDPEIEILPWEYNIDFRPTRVEIKRYVTSLLPEDTIPLLTWENGKSFELDGLKGYLRDYSISQVGPAEVSAGQIEEADRRGMKVYCKADSFATWQFGTTPYLPVPQQWQKRYDKLAEYGIDGTLETWSNGYKPNFVANLRGWSCWSAPLEFDSLLSSMARRQFGSGSEDDVVKAWDHFSKAIQFVPDTGPSMGTNSAVAQPLFFDEPPPRIMTLHNSWWEEKEKFHWRHRVVDYWPYAHRIMVFQPDFKNRKNQAEVYARIRSGIGSINTAEELKGVEVLPVFNKYVLLAADELEKGLVIYRKAAMNAPEMKKATAFHEVLVAEQMQRMLRSLHAILEFEDLRFRLMSGDAPGQSDARLDRMIEILHAEIARTEASLETAKLDSRLGYESEMDYVYTPFVLKQKLEVLREVLGEQIPAFRSERKR